MPRPATILAGIALVTALTYQSRINLISNTAHVQKQIDEMKEKADSITRKENEPLVRLSLGRPTTSVEQFVDDTKSYYKDRLVPSDTDHIWPVKESWNAQIIHVTSVVIQSNVPSRIGRFVATNVFGCK